MKFKLTSGMTAIYLLLVFVLVPHASYGQIQIKFSSFVNTEKGVQFVLLKVNKDERTGELKYDAASESITIDWRSFTTPISLKLRGSYLVALGPWRAGDKPKLLTQLTIPESGKRFIAIILPDEKTKVRVEVINSDDNGFRNGDVKIYNLTSKDVYGILEGSKTIITSKEDMVYRPTKTQATGTYGAKFFTKEKGGYKVFRSTSWPYTKRKRAFVFFYQPRTEQYIQMRAIDEYTTWKLDAANE